MTPWEQKIDQSAAWINKVWEFYLPDTDEDLSTVQITSEERDTLRLAFEVLAYNRLSEIGIRHDQMWQCMTRIADALERLADAHGAA